MLILWTLMCLAGGWVSQVAGQTPPPAFSEEVVFSGLTEPTSVQFASDGRVFVAEKSGLIKVFASLSATTPTVFADLRTNVYNFGKSGLLGMSLHPNFPSMPYVYVLYTYDAPIGGTAPQWGTPGTSADPCPPPNNGACVASGRLTRLQANGNAMTGTEQVLVANWYQHYPGQPVGGLAFGPDGWLYASAGDGASGTVVDFGQTDIPSPDPLNEGGALRSQDLRTPADPVTLSGSVIRIDPSTGQPLPQSTSMIVGSPTVDANGVKSFAVTSVFQGPQPVIVRILEPTNPPPGSIRRFLYVLPVQSGLTGLGSPQGDGLEELRLLDVHNRYNVTIIAPTFHIEPWYGDHDSNPDRRLESFVVRDLVPFGDSFGTPGQIPQRWILGFSKSGTGALSLILRNPNVFSAAAAWDGPAQFTDMSAFPGMVENFGTEENFNRYEVPTLVAANAAAFLTRNRIWISGDESAWTSHMVQLHNQMVQAGVLHTFAQTGPRDHVWYSGWLESAVASLSANATPDAPVDANAQRIIAYGLRNPSRFAFRPGTGEIWLGDAGWNDWEEINRIASAADGTVENYGWPCYEGDGTNAYSGAALDICNRLYGEPTSTTRPLYAYHHSAQVVSGEQGVVGSGVISGLAFYTTGNYPAAYNGALFFSDYSRNRIWAMLKGPDGLPDPTNRATAAPVAANPVDLKIGPGGDLFYVDLNGGTIRRITSLAIPPDTTPPVRSNGSPAGTLAVGTTQTILNLATNENATCRYSAAAGVAYGSMPNTFTTTGGTAHSTTITGLTNGGSYSCFVRCQDVATNTNTDDFTISFSVASPSVAGLVAAYSFNEGTGTSTGDATGNGHTGAISGATWNTQGKFGNALSFDGVNDWTTVNATSLLNLTTGMTVEAWVFPTSTSGVRDILIKEGSNVDIYNLYARNGAGRPESNVFVGGQNRIAEGTALTANVWTHAAGTYDGSTLRLFINGVQVASTNITGSISTSTGPLRIGGNSMWGEFFQGRIDEIRIYNRALSAAEIQSDMATPVASASGIPTVAITSPSEGTTVAGTVNITANASDDVGVVGVQFLLDGANLGAEDTTSPYSMSWDTTTATGGPHTLSARARDGDGNSSTSQPVSVAVQNNPVPGNFQDEVVIGTGLTFPTAFEFLPNGRMLITEFRGRILVVQPGASVVDQTPVIDLPNIFQEDVTVGGERGLVNIVADPSFASNGFIYVFYTSATPQRDRVSRLTMIGNTANPGSELVVWQGVADSNSTDHHGGGLAFGPDGKLYISTGDLGDPPSSQPLTSDHGKILRVNKDGTVPTDNPFFDGNGSNVDAIWARGVRNPYRFSFDSANGRMYIGDVGQNTTEEVNIGAAGANYGWPTCEGPCVTPGMTNPIFSYPHNGRDSAVTGGFVYRGSQFPPSYQGAYFYGDFAQNWIRYLTLDGSGNVTGNTPFLPPDGTPDGPFDPIMLKPGPDGSLYYVDFGWGWQETVNPAAIRRIRFISGNQPPVVAVAANPQNGQPPLSVSFSSAGSSDPENQPLTYAWTFGDGATSTAPNPVHQYAQSGLYQAQLSISDGIWTTNSNVLSIAVGNPPQSTITSPTNGFVFRAGNVINFSGTATDQEDGPLPPSAYSWTILFHHDTHVHPTLGPLNGVTSGTLTIPTTGHEFAGNTSYEIILNVTDSTGLQHTSSVFVFPHKVNLTFVTEPAGLTVNVGGISHVTPYVLDTLTGFQHVIEAPSQTQGSVNYTFGSWSDGGAQSHTITAGEVAATYTAAYQGVSTVTASPSGTTILTGTLSSGNAAALVSDDNVYFAVNSTTTGTRTAAWYGSFTGVANNLSNLRVNYKGNNSRNSTQTVAIWNWTTSVWVQLDSRTVGTTEVAINNLLPTGILADYVSGTTGNGDVRVRIQAQAAANLTNRGDVMSIVYDVPVGPPPPDITAPVRSNGAPTGTLAAGTTQATLSLATDENAVCRYATTAGVAYGSMPNAFSMTGGAAHTTTVTGLTNGSSYNFFVRCQDAIGNANTNDFTISFSVAVQPSGGLVAAYGFNEGVGTSAADSSGNGHTGTISGATWSTLGKFGNALLFDGVNDWTTVNAGTQLNLTTGMTIEAWVFPTSTSGVRDILIKEGSGVDIYNLYARNGAGRPEANVFVGGQNRIAEGTTLTANVWTHMAGTYDGSTVRLFINGIQVASTTITGSISTSTGPLRIGGNSLWGEFFQGRIDEIRIYNRALSATEIQGDMATPVN